jgi:single-strand DNA-binding protein
MFDTQVTVVGNLVADPRLNFTRDGQPVASFRLASTPRRFDRASSEWRDGDTLYANVTCWRGLAENVAATLKKGQSAIVIGRLSVRPYETKEGEKRQSVDIDALAVGPELARAIAVVKRAERGAALAPVPGMAPTDGESRATEPEWAWRTTTAADEADIDPSLSGGLEDDADADADADADTDTDTDTGTDAGASADATTSPGGGSDLGATDAAPTSAPEVRADPELVGAGGRLKARFGIG